MNERIRQLAIEAKLIASEPNGFDQNNLSKAQQKFAELITAECISIVTKLSPNYPLRYKNNLLIEIHHRDQIEEVFRGDCVEEIKQHFGVE